MKPLLLHEFHAGLDARFTAVNGVEAVDHYGDPLTEHAALCNSAGVLDLGFRSRLCLTGDDRRKFLHGQVTNDVNGLQVGQGCYAALVNAKGKMQSDLNIYRLPDELLLDFEPGYSDAVARRLEKYVIADDVQVVDVTPHYGLLSVQGPKAAEVIRQPDLGVSLPAGLMTFLSIRGEVLGEIYLMNSPRAGGGGFDLFVPCPALGAVLEALITAAKLVGGRASGWQALETARIEAGIPRYGADMDETNLPPEAGLEDRAISYTKGCYIGQEVIARIRTYGQVAKALCGLRLADDLGTLPARGDKLFKNGKEVGYVTSACKSPTLKANLALGFVRREANQPGAELALNTAAGNSPIKVVALPFGRAETAAL